jgi:hypothetical protein
MSDAHTTPAATSPGQGLYGVMAEFTTPDALIEAARRARAEGFTKVEAYTPFPIEEVSEVLGHKTKMPLIVLIGGLLGMLGGYGLQYWTQVIVYPMNIGGRPFHSWPAFIVPTFETTILGASLAAVIGMIVVNGLPQPYHPVFNVPGFERASSDRYFLVVESTDPKFDHDGVRRLFQGLSSSEVSDVSH